MILKIRKKIDPILREPTDRVCDFDFEFQKQVDNLINTMRKNNGIGLASPQVGILKKFFVCEFEGDKENNFPAFPLTVICNPEIVNAGREEKNMVEGCLSFPGMWLLIKRPANITIKGFDRYGKPIEIKADGIYARVLQHEFDHLNSILMIDRLQKIDIIFIGTGTLGARALELLARDPQYNIKAVVISKYKAVSRKKLAKENPVFSIANKFKLPVIETADINNKNIIAKIKTLKPKVGVMADFGQIIGKEILSIPKFGIINIHPSLLPKHRGSSPVQNTILNGDTKTGVTLMLTSEKMDAGGIISQAQVELPQTETSTILKNYLSKIGSSLLLNSLPYYLAGDLKPISQDENEASYTKLIKKDDGFVDKNTPAIVVERKIRAFDAWPKVYTIVKDKKVQLLSAHFNETEELVIDRVKPEGKKEMNYDEFVRGYRQEIKFPEKLTF